MLIQPSSAPQINTATAIPPSSPEVVGLLAALQELYSDAAALLANYTPEAATLADRLCAYGYHNAPDNVAELSQQYVGLMIRGIDFDRFANAIYQAGGFANDLRKIARLWLDDRLAPWDRAAFCAFQSEEPKLQLTSLQLDLRWCQLCSGAGLSWEGGKVYVDRSILVAMKPAQRVALMQRFVTWCSDQLTTVRRLHALANARPANE